MLDCTRGVEDSKLIQLHRIDPMGATCTGEDSVSTLAARLVKLQASQQEHSSQVDKGGGSSSTHGAETENRVHFLDGGIPTPGGKKQGALTRQGKARQDRAGQDRAGRGQDRTRRDRTGLDRTRRSIRHVYDETWLQNGITFTHWQEWYRISSFNLRVFVFLLDMDRETEKGKGHSGGTKQK